MRMVPLVLLPFLGACSLAPDLVVPAAPVPPSWPTGDAYAVQNDAAIPVYSHRDAFRDPRLLTLIDTALSNNRDLRIAAASVAIARERARIQRAEQLPVIRAGVDASVTQNGAGSASQTTWRYAADVGVTSFEIDLFGRLASLSEAEQARYLGTEAAARATRIALVGDLVDAWINYAADAELLAIAEKTAKAAEQALSLTRARLAGGVAPRTDVRQAEQILSTAQSDIARQRAALAQDINLLSLLVGTPVDPSFLPTSLAEADTAIAVLPAGLQSEVLLRRPDVVQAEYDLRAANATIGAARAALFPRISLTGVMGVASTALGSLFEKGSFVASGTGAIGYDIFSGGAAQAAVRQTQAQRDAAVAGYERAIQIAFRETADALALQGTLTDRLGAEQRLVSASTDTAQLTEARYRGGIDPFLASLDAQRALYAAQRTLIGTQRASVSNRVALYRALGGQ